MFLHRADLTISAKIRPTSFAISTMIKTTFKNSEKLAMCTVDFDENLSDFQEL